MSLTKQAGESKAATKTRLIIIFDGFVKSIMSLKNFSGYVALFRGAIL